MIEPQSAQEGASAWDVNVTWPRPMPRLPRVLRVPLLFPLPLPLLLAGITEAEGVESTPPALTLLAGGGEAAALS